MSPQFIAGFFAAWTAIYVAAFSYSVWATKRAARDRGDIALLLLYLTLAVFAVAAVGFLMGPSPTRFQVAIATFTSLLAPAFLADHVSAQDPEKKLRPYVIVSYGLCTAFATVTAAGVLLGPNPTDTSFTTLVLLTPGEPTHITTAGKILTSVVITATTYREARLFIAGRRGLGAFFGAIALSVAATHDAAMSVSGGSALSVTSFGYAAFAMGLFISQLARFTALRERLVKKTRELQERSELVARAFKELRAAQTELVRKEQLAAIGELSAVVAHEVRNPLAVISNAVATLRRDDVKADDRDTLLKILEEETSRLNQLVGDLLHYARPLAPESQLVPVRELVERAIAPLRQRIGLEIEIVETDPVGSVAGDPMLLRQAFDNVVHNAVQAMPTGGTLRMVLERSGEAQRARVSVRFSDTGEGMDTVVRKRALDPFFTTRPSGTGLGLAIVARVVDAHGGELTITSSPGAGTEVAISLPVTTAAPRASRRKSLSISSFPELADTADPGPPEVASTREEKKAATAAGGGE